jgi:hypothetical protein
VGGGPKGKIQLGRNWCKWEENISFSLKEIGRNGVGMINLAKEKDKWHTIVNMSWKNRFYKRQDIS